MVFNTSKPKVSVVIPAYNEEKYIFKTLTGIASQSYKDYEIIVVNNNSTDATEKIINYFLHKKLTSIPITIVNETRQGTNYAREAGRRLAQGEIIALLDADCLPNYYWIENGVKKLKHTNTVAATGAYYYFDANIFLRIFSYLSQLIVFKIVNRIIQWKKKGAILIGGNAFVSKVHMQMIGGFNTNLTFYGDDTDIAIKLSNYGNVSYSSSLTLNTSSRRYKALGFWNVNKKYQAVFKELITGKMLSQTQSLELMHPR